MTASWIVIALVALLVSCFLGRPYLGWVSAAAIGLTGWLLGGVASGWAFGAAVVLSAF